MDNAPLALQGAKSEAKNLEKSLSEFGIREGEKVKIEKERGLVIRELSASGSGSRAHNEVY
jgi:Fe2+ transport system protein FeoA